MHCATNSIMKTESICLTNLGKETEDIRTLLSNAVIVLTFPYSILQAIFQSHLQHKGRVTGSV